MRGFVRDRREPGRVRPTSKTNFESARATSTISSCRTSSSPRPPSSPTSSCRGRRRGARAKEPSPTPSVACSGPQGARSARRRTPRHLDPARDLPPTGPRVDRTEPLEVDPDRAAFTVTDARRACRTRRLDELGGIQWPCPPDDRLEPSFLHSRLWGADPAESAGPHRSAPSSTIRPSSCHDEYPLRLTTGRRLDSYNTGAQSGGFQSPLRCGETIDVSPEDVDRLDLVDGETGCRRLAWVRGRSAGARGRALRPGLVFMTFHFPDEIDTNLLTIDRDRPEVGHRRVQGCGGAHRQDRRPCAERGRLTFYGLVGFGRMDLKVASARVH